MKRTMIILAVAAAGFFSWAMPARSEELTPQEKEELARSRALAQEAISFQTAAAQNARNPGSPVGPPQRVTLCYHGHTITVAEPAVPALLKNGAKLGPCSE